MNCIFCWKYDDAYPRQEVKLKNSKYCKLYTKYENLPTRQITHIDRCKTLYTKCDYILEQKVHENIMKLEEQLKEYEKLVKQEMQKQKELINDMWIQSQKYLVLTRSGVCVKPYPEIISNDIEKRILRKFHKSLKSINLSNCILVKSMENIITSLSELNKSYKQLDTSVESPFVNGNYFLKSLSYNKNILYDLIRYFYSHLWKIKNWALLLDPGDSVSIEDYMILIKPDEQHVIENLSNCYCLRRREIKFTPSEI